jgi:SAM-dependent methyltransferase
VLRFGREIPDISGFARPDCLGVNRFHCHYCRSRSWARRLETSLLPWVLRDTDLGDDVIEIGPGPGLTTDLLRARVPKLTAVEIDEASASSLRERLAGSNVEVVNADATDMPLPDGRFSAAVSFTMLHHVPSADLQDRLLAEVRRVLRPAGWFVGSDSTPSALFRVAHLFDTMVLVDPDTFGARLERAGFTDVKVRTADGAFRFRGRVPA